MSAHTLASGAPLTQSSFDDFVRRLKHDCEGDGVKNHYTADAIFIVQARRIVSGIDPEYTDKLLVYCDDSRWFSPDEYWNDLGDGERKSLDVKSIKSCGVKFIDAAICQQWDLLGGLEHHCVTGWDEKWEYVCAHFTNDAAEAFILRKKHDYRDGIRVYVDAQVYAWEFNAIKKALMNGQIIFSKATGDAE